MKKSELKELIKSEMFEGYNYYEDSMDEAEKDISVDDEGDIELEEPTSELEDEKKDIQSNLTLALDAAKELGDKKLIDQIGNTITFFTRIYIVGDGDSVEGNELNEENIGLADLEEMGYEAGETAFDTHFDKSLLNNRPDTQSYKKGFVQAIVDSASDAMSGVEEGNELNEGYTRMKKLAGLIK